MSIYLDNAATGYPKPERVVRAVEETLRNLGGSAGRSGHPNAVAANRIVFRTRSALAELMNCPNDDRVLFTSNATEATNLAIHGVLQPGDHVVISAVEHNSVSRPVQDAVERLGVTRTVLPADKEGALNPRDLEKAIRPETRLVAISHLSNVTGQTHPIEECVKIAHEHGALILVDAAQSGGVLPIDFQAMGMDLLALTGHKGLMGPQGSGALIVAEGVDLVPLKFGGTGVGSEDPHQPEQWPERFESGTLNTPGIAGLGAGVEFIQETGVEKIRAHESKLIVKMHEGLKSIRGVRIYGPSDPARRVNLIAFDLEGTDPTDIALRLEEEAEIYLRVGLHCAPMAHRALGTFPAGTLRASVNYFNTDEEVDRFLEAVEKTARSIP